MSLLLCAHISNLCLVQSHLGIQKSFRFVCFILVFGGQDHTAFNCWRFLRRQPACVPVRARRSRSCRFPSNRGRINPEWTERGRVSIQGRSRKVKEQGEKGTAGTESCRSWRLLLTSDSGSHSHVSNTAMSN